MPVYLLPEEPVFPPPHKAEGNGLLAVGGDLSPQRLLAAYRQGIFPWYSEDNPILWWSPDPRLILTPSKLHVPRSLKKVMRKPRYTITFNGAFEAVIRGCAQTDRGEDQGGGTWITQAMIDAYVRLHQLGHARSVEAWSQEEGRSVLAGGCYGLSLGRCFFGESMFHLRPDASKVAFVALVRRLEAEGVQLIDCQMKTDHLLRFGAWEVPRATFLSRLHALL